MLLKCYLTNLHLKLLSTQGTGADKLLSTQRVKHKELISTYSSHFSRKAENYRPVSLTCITCRLVPMWQQSGTLLFCSCHGNAAFFVDELQI